MNILVDWGGYALLNHGDTAMLQVAVTRLTEMFPQAQIQALCHDPLRLQELCPGARGLRVKGRDDWFMPGSQIGRLQKFSPGLERRMRQRLTIPSQFLTLLKIRLQKRRTSDARAFFSALQSADLVLAAGGGYFNDSFPGHAYATLETLRLATRMGKPVALLGQGVGPLDKPGLRGYASEVLPEIKLIGVREACKTPALLEELGVNPERIVLTGDDAIELAFRPHQELGDGIGVGLRMASYSQVNSETLNLVRRVLHEAAHQRRASLIPTPISLNRESPDYRGIRELLCGFDDHSDGGASIVNPQQVIEAVSQCRIVVTGTYHAAVFALAQGISVVGLAQSPYYAEKLGGLVHQFGAGCQMIILDQSDAEHKLRDAIAQAWEMAPAHRAELLGAAQRQIEQSRAFYQKLPALL